MAVTLWWTHGPDWSTVTTEGEAPAGHIQNAIKMQIHTLSFHNKEPAFNATLEKNIQNTQSAGLREDRYSLGESRPVMQIT